MSKKSLGTKPTYKVCVPKFEVFIVDGIITHNTNFMPVREISKMPGMRGSTKGLYDKADSLYNAMIRRMKSRFMTRGKLPGKIFTLSSAQYPNDFIERKMKQAVNDDRIFVRNYALWEPKPAGTYSDKTFEVEVGTDLRGSRILTGKEPPDSIVGQIIEVPEDFKRDFEADTEGSIRDIAGIATLTVDQFIKDFPKVIDCIDRTRHHPFTNESTTLADGHMLRRRAYLERNPEDEESVRLIYGPGKPRVAHIDPSLSGDSTGVAVGHIADLVKVVRKQEDGSVREEWAPKIHYDLLLRVVPPTGGEIQLDRVRDIIYTLIGDGMPIRYVTMDQYQSAESRQQFRRRGIMSDLLSVDREMGPYEMLKAAFYERRVSMYYYEPALNELRQLEHDRTKNKVDHPDVGSKDVSDAMAGVAYVLTEYAAKFYKPSVKVSTFG